MSCQICSATKLEAEVHQALTQTRHSILFKRRFAHAFRGDSLGVSHLAISQHSFVYKQPLGKYVILAA